MSSSKYPIIDLVQTIGKSWCYALLFKTGKQDLIAALLLRFLVVLNASFFCFCFRTEIASLLHVCTCLVSRKYINQQVQLLCPTKENISLSSKQLYGFKHLIRWNELVCFCLQFDTEHLISDCFKYPCSWQVTFYRLTNIQVLIPLLTITDV